MYTMELSGVHIGKEVKFTYKFKSRPHEELSKTGYLGEIRHMGKGEVWITLVGSAEQVPNSRSIGGAFRVPFDGVVEFL